MSDETDKKQKLEKIQSALKDHSFYGMTLVPEKGALLLQAGKHHIPEAERQALVQTLNRPFPNSAKPFAVIDEHIAILPVVLTPPQLALVQSGVQKIDHTQAAAFALQHDVRGVMKVGGVERQGDKLVFPTGRGINVPALASMLNVKYFRADSPYVQTDGRAHEVFTVHEGKLAVHGSQAHMLMKMARNHTYHAEELGSYLASVGAGGLRPGQENPGLRPAPQAKKSGGFPWGMLAGGVGGGLLGLLFGGLSGKGLLFGAALGGAGVFLGKLLQEKWEEKPAPLQGPMPGGRPRGIPTQLRRRALHQEHGENPATNLDVQLGNPPPTLPSARLDATDLGNEMPERFDPGLGPRAGQETSRPGERSL